MLLLFIVGCDGTGGGVGKTLYDPYHGSEGLRIKFLDNTPPKEIKFGSSFMIGVEVSNEGAFDINDGLLTLNYIPEDISVSGSTKQINLYGRSKVLKQGEKNVVFWDATATNAASQDELTTKIWITTFYKYQTNAFFDICIDPDLYGATRQKTCQSQKSIGAGSQGAPVGVSRIEMSTIPESETSGNLEFIITVSNVDQGSVYGGNDASNQGELDIVSVSATLSNTALSCDPPRIKLEDKTGKTTCKARYNTQNEYKTPLHITLDYVYKELIHAKEVILKKA